MRLIETFDVISTRNPLNWRGNNRVRENQETIMTRKRTSENDLSLSAGASAAPSRRKPASRTRAKHSVSPEAPSISNAEPEIAAPQAVAAIATYQPSREEIQELAFLYWEARGGQGGSAEEDWLRAERELRIRTVTVTA
jgi:hypothetical protein